MITHTIKKHESGQSKHNFWVIKDNDGRYLKDPVNGMLLMFSTARKCFKYVLQLDHVTHVEIEDLGQRLTKYYLDYIVRNKFKLIP